ncbi:hypothetical protein TIFTF001_053050, partial [Ficus carica]
MDVVCVFIKYNGQWDGILKYIGGEMKGILVPVTATYVGLIKLVRSVIGIRGLDKTIVMRYGVEPGMPPVRIQCDANVKFHIQLKKKDVHVLSKFPISIDVLDESAAEEMPPEVGESNHIDVQPSREGGQSDEAMQPVNDSNLIILPPRPPHIPYLTICLDLHTEYGIKKQHQLLNNDLCTDHDDCNAGELNVADAARHSNEKSITASIRAHYIVNNTISQSVNVSSSDSLSGSVVVADFTPVTMSRNYDEGCPWQLRATRMRCSELFVVKRYDDVHTCSIEIIQKHHRQAESWMIGEYVKTRYLDPTNTIYRPREIMQDMQAEFGVSFNYLRAWRGKEAALTSLRGDDAELYKVLPAWAEMVKRKNPASDIHIETDLENCLKHFYMCLAASKHSWPYCRPVIVVDGSALKARFGGMLLAACDHDANGSIFLLAFGIVPSKSNESWKWFCEKLKDSIGTRESLAIVADRHKGIEYAANLLYPDAAFGICVKHLATNLKTRYKDFKGPLKIYFDADQFEYAITNNVAQIWIVDMSGKTCTCRRFQVDQIPCPDAMARDEMFLKKLDRKLSILPIQNVVLEGHGFVGFCPKVKNMRLFGVVDVMVMDTTDKPVLTQYPYAYVQQQGRRHHSQLP